ncbi:MAG TPA: hypothetical protein VN814_02760 [Caulobacteraceae bacterium]|nr:hypothetical protein [Caulobacteraceae bacterium]
MWQAALALLALAEASSAPVAPRAASPLPAPPLYVTHNQGLAITIPPGLTYCPLPPDWVGADHGVELYLAPPTRCGAAGYASSDRDVAPDEPMIEIYYQFKTNDYVDRRRCAAPVALRLFDRPARACRRREDGWITVETQANYAIGNELHDLVLTLRTTKARFSGDLARFRSFAKGVRVCRPEWSDGDQPACPKTQWF